MRIECSHGYFKFIESEVGEISQFMSTYDLDLVRVDDYFTFEFLEDAPKYSILGSPILGLPAIVTFEGEPWEVMRENKLVYNFSLGLVVPILSVTNLVKIRQAENYYFADGLLLPGSIKEDGMRVTDYSAWFDQNNAQKFKYSEVSFE